MVEPNMELPNVEEPTKEAEVKVETNVSDLVAELEKAGVTTTEELSGKLRAGSEAGNLARLLGDERAANQELQEKVRKLETRPPQQDYMDYPEGQTIDIEAAMEKGISKALDKRDKAAQMASQRSMAAWNYVRADKDYHIIKDVWEEKLKDPSFVYEIQSGQKDPVNEYNETLRGYYKTLLKQSHETITTMQGGEIKPPHVETGERSPANIVSDSPAEPESVQKMRSLKEKIEKGHIMSNEEELAVIDSLLDAPIVPDVPPRR